MKEIKVLKGNKIYFPKGSSKWCFKHMERTRITRLKVESRGRGIAGESWYEYVLQENDIKSNELQKFVRYDGEVILLNTNNIVIAEDFDLVQKEYITLNDNYEQVPQNLIGTKEAFDKWGVVHIVQWLVPCGVKVELVGKYVYSG